MTTVGYGDKTPKSRGGKMVALVWMFSGLLFISGLTASVASSLTVDQLTATTTKFEDFKDRPVGTIQHSSSEQYLKNNFFKDVHLFENVPSGLDALVEHKLDGFVYDEPIIRYRIKNDEKYENLEVLPQKFKVQYYAFALPKKHNELRNLISQKILDITERTEWQVVLNEYGCGEE
jgi:ABC-type amino acid transport substrate-binding protein